MNDITKNFVSTCKELADLDLEIGPSGNLSFRGTDDEMVITPTGSYFGDIAENFLALCRVSDGGILKGAIKPSSDLKAHIEIYKQRSDVQAILHTHAHFATVLAMLGQDIPVHNTMHADYFGGTIKCVPFANHRQHGYGELSHFKSGRAFLLEKHGALIVFNHQNMESIVSEMRAFAEIARLHYDFLVGSSALSIERESIAEDHLKSIHKYYKTEYGNEGES